MKKIDMSDKAITRRLKQTDQLRELSLSLMKAKEVTDEKVKRNQSNNAEDERLTDSEIHSLRREAAEALREMKEMPPMFSDLKK